MMRNPWKLLPVVLLLLPIGGCRKTNRLEIEREKQATSETGAMAKSVDLTARVEEFCGACHAYPDPETLPRSAWQYEVQRGFSFGIQAGMLAKAPPLDAVIRFFEQQAPEFLITPPIANDSGEPPVRFETIDIPTLEGIEAPAISNVALVHLTHPQKLDLLACDMRAGLVLHLKPYEEKPQWRILLSAKDIAPQPFHPAHLELVDLNRDGVQDILVSNLGSFAPTDDTVGSVILMLGNETGGYTAHTLLDQVGRVADVRASDFRGTGQLDLLVAVFGWHRQGDVRLLENHTTDWSRPVFSSRTLDPRHGAIHVPITDLNADGHPDFFALFSQEHECVDAFVNDGRGSFQKHRVFTADHPGSGSSGIEMTDYDRDGDQDLLLTSGDALDEPYILKPYHEVRWLENKGSYPFTDQVVTGMYGVHRALAGDFADTGRNDIISVAFLPLVFFPNRVQQKVDGIVYLEHLGSGQYRRFSLTSGSADHVTAATGDIWGRGRTDFVTGNFTQEKSTTAVTIWRAIN